VFSLGFKEIRVFVIDNGWQKNQSTCKRLHFGMFFHGIAERKHGGIDPTKKLPSQHCRDCHDLAAVDHLAPCHHGQRIDQPITVSTPG
jgi:hypothetical protein